MARKRWSPHSFVKYAIPYLTTAAKFAGGLGILVVAARYVDQKRRRPNKDLSFLEGDLVYVPGFKGTHLVDSKTGETVSCLCELDSSWSLLPLSLQVFFNLSLALNLSQPDFRLETDWNHPCFSCLVPGEVISDVCGGLINICADFRRLMLSHSKSSGGSFRYHEFTYDWRQDNLSSAQKLAAFVRGIHSKNGRPVLVVGHSMGGLLALHLLHTHPEMVRGLLLVGSPVSSIRGVIKVLNAGGDSLLFNRTAHSDLVQSTWMSGYSLLCTDGRDTFIDVETGESVHIDFWDAETWIKRQLSTAIRHAVAMGHTEAARNFMRRVLHLGKQFNSEMRRYDPDLAYPPIGTIHGRSKPLGYTYPARFSAAGALEWVDWENPVVSVPGDGTVPLYSTMLPEGIPVLRSWESRWDHRSMMNDPVVFEALRCIAVGERGPRAANAREALGF